MRVSLYACACVSVRAVRARILPYMYRNTHAHTFPLESTPTYLSAHPPLWPNKRANRKHKDLATAPKNRAVQRARQRPIRPPERGPNSRCQQRPKDESKHGEVFPGAAWLGDRRRKPFLCFFASLVLFFSLFSLIFSSLFVLFCLPDSLFLFLFFDFSLPF